MRDNLALSVHYVLIVLNPVVKRSCLLAVQVTNQLVKPLPPFLCLLVAQLEANKAVAQLGVSVVHLQHVCDM